MANREVILTSPHHHYSNIPLPRGRNNGIFLENVSYKIKGVIDKQFIHLTVMI